MAAKKQKNNSINLLKGITGSRLARIIAVVAIVLTIPVTVLMSQKQQNTRQEASTSYASCGLNNMGSCIDTLSTSCPSPKVKIDGLCPQYGNSIKCCYPPSADSNPTIIELKSKLLSRSGTSCKVQLYAKATDPKSKELKIQFKYRHENICTSAKLIDWFGSPRLDLGNIEEFKKEVYVTCGYNYYFSARARSTTNYQTVPDKSAIYITKYSIGKTFCGDSGWFDAQYFRF